MSSADKNKALVRRFLEERIKGNLKAVNEMLAPDFVDFVERSLLSDQELSREDYKRSMVDIATAFSIGDWTIEDQIAEGDKVMTRWTARCVHNRGKFMGVAPTGLEGTYTGVEIHRIAGDKIAEEWSESDFSNVMRQRLEQEMREREHIEQELQVARRIQQASLPRDVPTLAGWQINPFFQPAREVGGDFYEFFELDDGRVGFAVGDATGKGVPAALVMTATCAFLGGVATASGASPGEVLARANEAVLARIPPNMFVTCFYAILEPKRGSLSYANAGHDLPYLWQGGDCEELRARGMPLGLMPGMDYEEKEIVLDEGEAALFYSDGLVEAHDPKGEMFGFPRLRALVTEYGKDHSLVDSLLKELYSFTGEGWEQEDDITLLTLRRSTARH